MAPALIATPSTAARRRRNRERGQSLVLVALSITVMLGMAAVAIDAGRFLTQRRFLQNAADAGALAAANSVVHNATNASATVATAKQAARDVLAIDLAGSAVGAPTFTPADPPVFSGASTAANLVDGIVLADGGGTPLADTASLDTVADIRVALRGPVDFTLGRVVGINQGTVSARARVGFTGSVLPVAVRRYYNAPGPNASPANPCPEPANQSAFTDLAATQVTSCQGAEDTTNAIGYAGRTPASPSSPGPTVILVGQGATADNDNSFRGFITLDVRNFNDTGSRVYYNNVTAGTQQNDLKSMEAGWITAPAGYPGPDFPPIAVPPDPNDQVGVMDGNSAGIVVSDINSRFTVGSKVLCALYDGAVMSIPDFSMTAAGPIALAAGTTATNASSFTINPNRQFYNDSGLVDLAMLSSLVPGSPGALPGYLTGVTFNPSGQFSPAQNGTTATVASIAAAAGTSPQILTTWIRGHSASPYLKDHYQPVSINIGNVSGSLTLQPSSDVAPASWGDPVSFTLTLTKTASADFSGGVDVSLLGPGAVDTAFPNVASGSYWFDGVPGKTTTNVSLNTQVGNGQNATWSGTTTLTINTTLLGMQGSYPIVVQATGTNSAGKSITAQTQALVRSTASDDNSKYVDIVGFAVYQITAMDSNSVTGQAISAIRPTASDSSLRAALTPRLMPW